MPIPKPSEWPRLAHSGTSLATAWRMSMASLAARSAGALQRLGPGLDLGFEPVVQRLHLVVQRLDAQHGAHARDQCTVVDRLGEVVVAAGVETRDHVLR